MSVVASRPGDGDGPAAAPHTTLRVKLQVPPPRDDAVPRERLVDRVMAASEPVCLVVAPAGYGKTTLLVQLARRVSSLRTSSVAWVRLDETDDDPTVLLRDLVEAVAAVAPLDPDLRQTPIAPAELAAFHAPARFAQALSDLSTPLTLILDDLHLVTDTTARDWLAWLLDRLPAGFRVVLGARHEPDLPLGRLVAAGRLMELGASDLALDRGEVERMADQAGVALTDAGVTRLHERTEGWPLATHLLLASGSPEPGATGSAGRLGEAAVLRYLRSELLERTEPTTRDWVLRSAVLDEMNGPLCDAALETSGSLRMLRALERTNQLLLPLDVGRTSYRYHALYRQLLRTELEARLPGERSQVASRAATWLQQHDRLVDAGHLLMSGEELGPLAAFVERHGPAVFWRGGLATMRDWTSRFDHDGIRDRYAGVAVLGGWGEALLGHLATAQRWIAAAERSTDLRAPFDGSRDFSGWIAILRANMMPNGLEGHAADVEHAQATLPPDSPVAPQLALLQVVREVLVGRLDVADATARAAEGVFRAHGAVPGLTALLGVRAVIAVARADTAAAALHVLEGRALVERLGLEEYATSAMLYAVGARLAAQKGDRTEAGRLIARVNRLRRVTTVAIPWNAVMMRLQGIRAAIALREPAMARTLLAEIDDVLRVRPHLGALSNEVVQLRPLVTSLSTARPGPWSLTAAELRVLTYLPTHLTFREIADRVVLSPHTIKTQAMSIYGKLEVSSRREAIKRAVEVGLLDPSVLHEVDRVGIA